MRQWFVLTIASIWLTACGDGNGTLEFQGYAEGEFLRLAPREYGILSELSVVEGQHVEAGERLFALDDDRARLQLARSKASLTEANAHVSDMSQGGRTEELRAADQKLEQARADLAVAKATYTRTVNLVKDGYASHQRLDETKATYEGAKAVLEQAESQAQLVRLPSRTDAIAAAQANAAAAAATEELATRDLEDRRVMAPRAGTIEAIYYRAGEFVGAGQPVLSMLPPENIKVRFFVPEPLLPQIKFGGSVALTCDGCPDGLLGRISFIASQAEYTPPVIYSRRERAKLVFMVEAVPDDPSNIRPGQPFDVRMTP